MIFLNVQEDSEGSKIMYKRIISGIAGALFVLFVIFFNQQYPAILNVLTSIIAVLAMIEIFSVTNVSKLWLVTIPTLIFTAVVPLFFYGNYWNIAWYAYSLCVFSSMLLDSKLKLNDVTITYAMAILISVSFGCLIELRDFGNIYGSLYVLFGLAIAWLSDTGAYFCGKIFGKNKLCPEVSPKKTIEGFIGGMVVCVAFCVGMAFFINNYSFLYNKKLNYNSVIIMSFFGSMISAMGDLCFSAIKRKCGVKDFGNFMPGHGGILDRFDSVIFTVPYVYFFIKIFSIIG